MRRIISTNLPTGILLFISLTASCTKEKKEGCTDPAAINYDATAEENCYCCTYNGRVVFWNHPDDQYCNVRIWINGAYVGTITSDYAVAPSCDAPGCVTFVGKPGTYNVVAEEDDCDGDGYVEEWTGTVTITSGGCVNERLY